MAAQDIKVESVRLDDIFIVGERRPTEDDAVAKLARSIAELGLRTPITLRLGDVTDEDGDVYRSYILVAGGHRLAACRLLEWERIPAIVIDCDATDAEMWEIAENLHRADLSKAQRDEQIRRYAELLAAKETGDANCVGSLSDGRKAGAQHQKGVASKVAEQTGLSKDTVRRALNPDRVADEKKKRVDDAADRAEKAAEDKRQREAEQAENDRQRDEVASGFSEAIKAQQQARADAIAARKVSAATDTDDIADRAGLEESDRIAELEEEVRALDAEINRLRANLAEDEELERMRAEWRAGGWDKVVEKLKADHAFDVGVLKRQVERESEDKVSFKRRGDFYERKAREYGWSNVEEIDLSEGARG